MAFLVTWNKYDDDDDDENAEPCPNIEESFNNTYAQTVIMAQIRIVIKCALREWLNLHCLIISATEVMFLSALVCSLAGSRKNYSTDFQKIR